MGLLSDAAGNLAAARAQMALSLGWHIVIACLGVGFPLMIVIVEVMARRTGSDELMRLAKHWAQAAALLFAIGAVSGTILSFEMGLLWPGLMATFGPVFGFPFALQRRARPRIAPVAPTAALRSRSRHRRAGDGRGDLVVGCGAIPGAPSVRADHRQQRGTGSRLVGPGGRPRCRRCALHPRSHPALRPRPGRCRAGVWLNELPKYPRVVSLDTPARAAAQMPATSLLARRQARPRSQTRPGCSGD